MRTLILPLMALSLITGCSILTDQPKQSQLFEVTDTNRSLVTVDSEAVDYGALRPPTTDQVTITNDSSRADNFSFPLEKFKPASGFVPTYPLNKLATQTPDNQFLMKNNVKFSSKPFFKLKLLTSGVELPAISTLPARYNKILLSDLLVDLFDNITGVEIEIADDIEDQLIESIELANNLQDSLDKIMARAGIFYDYDGETIKLYHKQKFSIILPPVGYISHNSDFNAKSVAYNRNQNNYKNLLSILETFGADNLASSNNIISGDLDHESLPLITDYLNDLRKNHHSVAYKAKVLGYHTAKDGDINFSDIAMMSASKAANTKQDTLTSYVMADGSSIHDVIAILQNYATKPGVVDEGIMLGLTSFPVHFSLGSHPSLEQCNTDTNTPGVLQVTLQNSDDGLHGYSNMLIQALDSSVKVDCLSANAIPLRAFNTKIKLPHDGSAIMIDGIVEANNHINYLLYLEPTIIKFDAPPEVIAAYNNKQAEQQQAKGATIIGDANQQIKAKDLTDFSDNPFTPQL